MSAKTNGRPLRGLLAGIRGGARPAPDRSSFLHVAAHPDDDLYFMNPEILNSIRTGAPVTGVYLTSGEADGHNHPYGTPRSKRGSADHAAYARARQNGLKGAYATMALGDRAASWTVKKLTTPHGAEYEVFTLDEAPQVRLVFLNIRQHGRAADGRTARLRLLWEGATSDVPTIVPTGSQIRFPSRYSRADLLATLAFLLDTYRPTTVRTMDPDPDHQLHDKENPQHHDYGDHSDHQDHTAAALFTWEALRSYAGPDAPHRFTVEAYRGYYNERWPDNLTPRGFATKEFYLNIYGCADGYDNGDPAGGGDYEVAFAARGTGWGQATRHRYVGGADWLRYGPDGRLTAFGVLDQKVAVWTETAPGSGEWSGPEIVTDGPVAPRLAVDLAPDGCFEVFALRLTAFSGDPEGQQREIVTARQRTAGGAFSPWESLGNPTPAAVGRRNLGTPAVARDGAGLLHLLVRNSGRGVSSRARHPDGVWSDWRDLKGPTIQDGLTAVTAPNGTIDVFGAGSDRVRHWYQPKVDSEVMLAQRFRLSTPADPPTAVVADGRVQVFYRSPGKAGVFAAGQSGPAGGWNDPPTYVEGRGGFGAIAAVAAPTGDGTVLLAGRNDVGGIAYQFRHRIENPEPAPGGTARPEEFGGGWVNLPAPACGLVHSPAAAFDSTGRAVIAVLGGDGALHLRRQLEPGKGGFGDWGTATS